MNDMNSAVRGYLELGIYKLVRLYLQSSFPGTLMK